MFYYSAIWIVKHSEFCNARGVILGEHTVNFEFTLGLQPESRLHIEEHVTCV